MQVSVTFESKSVDAFSFTTATIIESIQELNARFGDLIKTDGFKVADMNQDLCMEESDSSQDLE